MDANTGLVLSAVVLNTAGVATLLIRGRNDKARDIRHREWEIADRKTLTDTVKEVKSEVVTRDENATKKLDHIEKLTNSSMDVLKAKLADALAVQEQLYDKLAIALARIDRLETLLSVKLGLDTDLPKDPA